MAATTSGLALQPDGVIPLWEHRGPEGRDGVTGKGSGEATEAAYFLAFSTPPTPPYSPQTHSRTSFWSQDVIY